MIKQFKGLENLLRSEQKCCWSLFTSTESSFFASVFTNPDSSETDVSDLFLFCVFYVGVPGVKPERLEEGMTVRHCALSLVGKVLDKC